MRHHLTPPSSLPPWPLPPALLALLLGGVGVGCVPLEERIELAVQEFCAPARDVVVDCVYDGDTFYVGGCSADQATDTIRLLGVQAPELQGGANGSAPDCYGEEAASFLQELLVGQQVRLEFDVACQDIYGRTLAWVWLTGSTPSVLDLLEELEIGTIEGRQYEVLVNELILRAGYAPIYAGDVAEDVRYETRLEDAEEAAITASEGLWTACEP